MASISLGAGLLFGSLGAGSIGAIASGAAASTQANAANNAAALQSQEAANALAFQKQEFQTNQTNEAPFIQAGQGAIGNLSTLLAQGQNGQGAFAPWTGQFQAPTAAQILDISSSNSRAS
jgi:hypothetical protein